MSTTLIDMAGFSFTEDVVAAVTEHMNADHAEDNRVICAWFTRSDVDAARLMRVHADGLDFAVHSGASEREVRVPWGREITERADIRQAVVELYQRAAAGTHDSLVG